MANSGILYASSLLKFINNSNKFASTSCDPIVLQAKKEEKKNRGLQKCNVMNHHDCKCNAIAGV